MEYKSGQMAQNTRVNGAITKQMVKESFGMQRVMSMKVGGKMTELMVTEYIRMLTELSMKDSGLTICSMEKV